MKSVLLYYSFSFALGGGEHLPLSLIASLQKMGNVTVALPAGVDPKTGRGVTITLKLMGSDDLSTWTQIETAGGTDNKTFAPVAPASGETKKFYKVVVEYAGSQN